MNQFRRQQMQSNDFEKSVQDFKDFFDTQMGKTEMVLETKVLVDKLILALLETTQNFVQENQMTNHHQYVGAMVTHRAFFYLSQNITANWCFEAIVRDFLAREFNTLKKENNDV